VSEILTAPPPLPRSKPPPSLFGSEDPLLLFRPSWFNQRRVRFELGSPSFREVFSCSASRGTQVEGCIMCVASCIRFLCRFSSAFPVAFPSPPCIKGISIVQLIRNQRKSHSPSVVILASLSPCKVGSFWTTLPDPLLSYGCSLSPQQAVLFTDFVPHIFCENR